ncbi:VolA/Pla-1 family phospholipase [Vibrio crassostreae]|uniref:VolA/Pla-1 family phospholipase n=1 Tax=Vibrio crassostreae TaxID=246167 RepID=UPI001048CA1D|nr:VolA/Pla-1 family phospholipase [Vibrio crassostreae]TCN96275.1 Pla-1/cef family extracellular lipase [Vibrio crassostreae]CAK1758291.1 Pla-1/cef family extracellular lipase [Vibrio crassostreae]CAK1789110.1 Pla-1/cef family extracellular lipase [Vibrio crassostreae]CAK2160730.1 Pla-1/cef family extracellular lipase [Vibrio crassostreae]CAK2558072.1 Pla-1/cef family extracellular lipase [Vibrio crassostreae]
MNNKFSLSLVCSALLLAGCGDNTESSGSIYSNAIEQSLARSSSVSFTLLGNEADIPLPSFFLFDTNDHTLNIPLDANSTGLLNDPAVAMGEADGWSTIMPFTINVNLPSDRTLKNDVVMNGTTPFSAHLNAGVKVAKVDVDLSTGVMSNFTALTAGVDYLVASSDFKTIQVLPLKGLDPSSDYIYALTDSIVDSADESLGTSSSYASLKTTDIDQAGSLDLPQKIIHQVEALFAGYGSVSSSDEIIYSSWFTTASAGNVMNGTKAAIAQTVSPAVTPSDIWKNLANPNSISEADLDNLYTFTVDGTKQDFATAVQADAMFKSAFGDDAATQLAAGYNTNFSTPAAASIQVYRGTVELPYFLSDSLTNNAWKTTPWRSAMPSVLTILNVLSSGSDSDKTAIATQLAGLGITEPATQLYQAEYQQLLIGEKLTLASGEQLDSARVMTKYSAVPQIRAAKSVPFVMFVPEGAAIDSSLPILQYQHGITSIKESAYAFAMQHIGGALTGAAPYKPYAIIAIDQPLHGQRALSADVVTTPTTPTVYMNLEYLPVARDNIRQSAIDGLGVRFALNSATDAAFSNLDKTNVSLFGHSIGAITGISSYTVGNSSLNPAIDSMFSYTSATLANPGGGIAPFLLKSGSFSPEIKHTVSLSSVTEYQAHYVSNCVPVSKSGGDCFNEYYTALSSDSASASDKAVKATIDSTLTSFTYAAQTVLDNVDPYNIASTTTGPVLGIQANGDETIPNSVAEFPTAGTEPLFKKLSLVNTALDSSGDKLASYFDKASSEADHSTVISQQNAGDAAANAEMTSQIVQFTLSQGTGIATVTAGLLDASK